MREMTPSDLLMILFSLWLVLIVILWIREYIRVRRNNWEINRSRLFHCRNCHYSFVPREPVSICRCPHCNTVCVRPRNSNIPRQRI